MIKCMSHYSLSMNKMTSEYTPISEKTVIVVSLYTIVVFKIGLLGGVKY